MTAAAGVNEVHPGFVGWGLTAVGFLTASVALIRMRDEFDLQPLLAASG